MPLLFTYGKCAFHTGCTGCLPCQPRRIFFFGADWTKWVRARGDNRSRVVAIPGAGHWTNCRAAKATNVAMETWLDDMDTMDTRRERMTEQETKRMRFLAARLRG